ncbi:MAG TPA: glycosyltransferase [Candidatus Dormibacteraeota bacterium]|nr:glycosyltransferase [Candidatus Dormibacteraeota bacterium]
MGGATGGLRVLVLSRNYPSSVMPLLGLWVEEPTALVAQRVAVEVVSPVPWCPPLPRVGRAADLLRFRAVPRTEVRRGVTIHHPRFPIGPGATLLAQQARGYRLGVERFVAGLRRSFPFDLIHAHFTYPDGVVAEWLGRRHGVPVVVTEHAPWKPWIDRDAGVRRQVVDASRRVARHEPVSRWLADQIASYTGAPERIRVVPNGVDPERFVLAAPGERDADRVLFVGFPRPFKGLDILLRAMRAVVGARPAAHLAIAGGPIFRGNNAYIDEMRALAERLGLGDSVEFLGARPVEEVARLMATSAVLVLPSTMETFGVVLVEALACGTPVIAAIPGGPEDVVTPEVGRLVPFGDDVTLAASILDILGDPGRYPPERLRAFALERFTWSAVAGAVVDSYREVLAARG